VAYQKYWVLSINVNAGVNIAGGTGYVSSVENCSIW
jgi:hypothetical protein